MVLITDLVLAMGLPGLLGFGFVLPPRMFLTASMPSISRTSSQFSESRHLFLKFERKSKWILLQQIRRNLYVNFYWPCTFILDFLPGAVNRMGIIVMFPADYPQD
ncbi:uncharacterized protein LOC124679220 [Lolium rigidum]|uniref:uncharacterized protein LOC124679220 n=1 Tax=Lolium rigidum TaxID=89674 RepID=UPI001F5C492C|nr:uncharacterized protein LOC124679220 [Lolium rigidum]